MNREEDISWNSLIVASLWVRHGIALAAALFLTAAGAYLFIFPLRDSQESLEQSLREAKARYAQRLMRLGKIPALSQLDGLVEDKTSYLRAYRGLPSGVQTLIATARRSGCQVSDVKHLADAESGAFWTQRWQLRLKGGYFQLFDFIQRIDNGAVAAAIERLVMEEEGGLVLSLTVTQYQLKEEIK